MSVFKTEDNDKTLVSVVKLQDSYVIPESIETIKAGNESIYAFYGARNTRFNLSFAPNCRLTYIGDYAFYKCRYLYNIDFRNAVNLKTIVNFAFANCRSLTKIEFPPSLEELGFYGTFGGCSSLINVTFPEESKLTIIESGTFRSSKLTTIKIPKNVNQIWGEAFASTPIIEFTLQEGNEALEVYNGSLYRKGLTDLISHQKATKFNISEKTTKIRNLAFSDFRFDVIIPTHVIEFERWAFLSFNGNLLIIMSSIEKISNRMFGLKANSKQLMFFGKIGEIEKEGISGDGLEVISFAARVSNIRNDSFLVDFNKVCFAFNIKPIQAALSPIHINVCTLQMLKTCQSQRILHLLIPRINILFLLL